MEGTNFLGLENATLMTTKHIDRLELIEKHDLINIYKDGATHIVGRKIIYDYDFPDVVLVEVAGGEFKEYTDDVFMLVYCRHDVIFIKKHDLFRLFDYTNETRIMLGLDKE